MISPYVSIIVCLYNTDPILFESCLIGLYNQTYTDFEVLIINDGSSKYLEENKSLINKLNDKRFKYFDKEHSGKSQTLNYALSKASGKYIAINDSDDISYPNRIKYQVEFLDNNIAYDLISNAMKREFDNYIFPSSSESCDINDNNLYNVNHPCSMFRKSIINKVPFLFSQLYDSMEDCIFNFICFYYGIKMYYDNSIMLTYAYHPNQVHYNNIHGFLKEVTYKLYHSTFNKNVINPLTTCILFLDDKWDTVEIEKTLLNIRLTANNVNIILCDFNNLFNNQLNNFNKYSVQIYDNKNLLSFKEYLNNIINNISTTNIMFINTPIRFYDQNWNIYLEREDDDYKIIEPILFDIEKIDSNTYYNENNKNPHKNELFGERLTLLNNELTEKIDKNSIHIANEYITESRIPILSNVNVFFIKTNTFNNILNSCNEINYFSCGNLFNVVFSLLLYCKNGCHIVKRFDLICGYLNQNQNNKTLKYYIEYYYFTYIFLNETQFINQRIIKEYVKNNFNTDISKFCVKDAKHCEFNIITFSDFLKNINSKEPWIL